MVLRAIETLHPNKSIFKELAFRHRKLKFCLWCQHFLWAPIQVTAALLPTEFAAPGKAVENDESPWDP